MVEREDVRTEPAGQQAVPPPGPVRAWRLPGRVVRLGGRPLVMGIVNVTPDSFADGGRFATADAAVAHALDLAGQGAEILDIGGESTRPGSVPVPQEEELARVLPVVEALAGRTAALLSVDTSKAAVARDCLRRGVHIVNDVTALAGDPQMAAVVRDAHAGAVLTHMRGTPATMQRDPRYEDVVADIARFFEGRVAELVAVGLSREQLVLDPGIGFGKTVAHNLELLARLGELQRLGLPVCLGASRKGFLGRILGRSVGERLAGSLAVVCYAATRGTIQVVRVHDVRETRDAVTLIEAIAGTRSQESGVRPEVAD
jgi:dihydropteroate synthase